MYVRLIILPGIVVIKHNIVHEGLACSTELITDNTRSFAECVHNFNAMHDNHFL